MMKRPRYFVEATTTFGERDSTGWHRDYTYTLPAAEKTAQQWHQCQYHDNVRVFRLDIGDELTDMVDLDQEDDQEQ
jgi:hypothetical protein